MNFELGLGIIDENGFFNVDDEDYEEFYVKSWLNSYIMFIRIDDEWLWVFIMWIKWLR